MTALLRLDNVTKAYQRGPREISVLRAVSVAVDAGEFVAVYGTRGAGKSTLLRLAAGFLAPDDGTVSYAGEALGRVSRRRLARFHREQIAWVERSGPASAELPVDVYVALPLYRRLGPLTARRRAHAALERVGAADAAESHWADLSDTARTLVAIAHALVRQPRVLIADDPTAGLDVIDRERVTGLLRSAADVDDCAVLMAAPELGAARHADRALLLGRGRLLSAAERTDSTVVEFPGSGRSA